jgi:hypothetical protein
MPLLVGAGSGQPAEWSSKAGTDTSLIREMHW